MGPGNSGMRMKSRVQRGAHEPGPLKGQQVHWTETGGPSFRESVPGDAPSVVRGAGPGCDASPHPNTCVQNKCQCSSNEQDH